jgi:hypothetical protein
MTTLNDNQIMPPMASVVFSYNQIPIKTLPVFLLLSLICNADSSAENEYDFRYLASRSDKLVIQEKSENLLRYLSYLKGKLVWQKLKPYLSITADTAEHLEQLWTNAQHTLGNYSLTISVKPLPKRLYRYMRFNSDWFTALFKNGTLYMPSPSQFNDPFDCNLDDSIRLAFIECAVGCFSAKPDDVLMFSHYGDHHRGICFGIDPGLMVESMSVLNSGARADIRPVGYLKHADAQVGFRAGPLHYLQAHRLGI